MRLVDLRSDTVTHPTKAMREAMANAEVGDDVWGDDPTVNNLEALAAEAMGKEAALFVASGTMANLVSILTHCAPGNEIIVGSESHIFYNEVGGASALAGVQVRTVLNDSRGMMSPEDVEEAIRGENIHFPPTGLVCIENTHNRCSGGVLTGEDVAAISDAAHGHNVSVHMDGARIFNAAVYLETPANELTKNVDSVSFCLSKGLSCPVGSLICGSQDFIASARKWRKMVGGGMRQVGIIAAAGIVALQTMIDRLAEDHSNARKLAEGLANIPGISIDPTGVQTNIVIFEVAKGSALDMLHALEAHGVRGSFNGGRRIRFVTHYGVTFDDIDYALGAIAKATRQYPKS